MPLPPPRTMKSGDPLRDDFFSLLQRSYLIAEKQGQGLATYAAIASLVDRWCGESWVRGTVFPVEVRLVRRFLAETKLPAADLASVVRQSLVGNAWKAIANGILQKLGRAELASLSTVTGIEHLRAAQAAGRGVVLAHSHTLFTQLFWVWLEHEGISPGVTIWRWAWEKDQKEKNDPRIRTLETARELHAAVASLRQGGLVQILADGDNGSGGFELPFCNRKRMFRPTFAELALRTDAPVLPVIVTFSRDGRIHIEIRPAFADAPGSDRAGRVERLVHQYAQHLRALWEANPAEVQWYLMRQHLALPAG